MSRKATPAPEAEPLSSVVIANGAPMPAPAALAIPLTSRAVFWRPRFSGATRSLVHLPFLFWLVETLRPTRIVQLGLEDPGTYLGLCQAVDKSGLEAICMGVEADPAQPMLTGEAAAQHTTLYGDFSFIAPDDLGQASRHMRSGGIDLLVLDLALDRETLARLQSHWLPNLSDRAVLVIHDPDNRLADAEARAFFAELQQAHPVISFPQANPGMEVLLIGAQQPERLHRLADLEIGMPGHLAAYQVFARLGQGLASEQHAAGGKAALERAVAAREGLAAQIVALEAQLAQERGEKAAVLASEAAQVTQLANLQLQLFEARQRHEDGSAQLAELQRQLEETTTGLAERTREIEALSQEKATLEAWLQEHIERIAELEEQLAKAEASAAAQETALREALEARSRQEQDLESLRAELAEAQEALQNSLTALENQAGELTQSRETLAEREAELQRAVAVLHEEKALHDALLSEAEAQAGESASRLADVEASVAAMTETHQAELRRVEAERQEAESRNERLTEEITRLREQLRQSRERRLAVWESQERLRSEHEALLSRDALQLRSVEK